mgnify:CR=1 FL=1
MKLGEMIDILKTRHGGVSEPAMIKMINRAMDEVCRESKILTGSFTFSTVANQRYYDLTTTNGEEIIEVISVDYDNKDIPRLTGSPETRDFV